MSTSDFYLLAPERNGIRPSIGPAAGLWWREVYTIPILRREFSRTGIAARRPSARTRLNLRKNWINPSSEPGAGSIVLRLTAIELLLRPMGPWGVRPFILALAGLALILQGVLRAPATWYALAGW